MNGLQDIQNLTIRPIFIHKSLIHKKLILDYQPNIRKLNVLVVIQAFHPCQISFSKDSPHHYNGFYLNNSLTSSFFPQIEAGLIDYINIDMKYVIIMAILASFLASASSFTLYTGGNSWSLGKGSIGSANFTYTSLPTNFSTYFYTDSSGVSFDLSVSMNSSVTTTVTVTIGTVSNSINVNALNNFAPINVGTFVSSSGYNQIITEITGVSPSSGKVISFDISGALTNLVYVPNNTGDNFYWGRRGSSASIFHKTNSAKNVTYYYSELTVPTGYDPLYSYYMANGFGQGYLGIQVNSPTQRKVLFSVWSGFSTNDPTKIPAEYTVSVNRIGPGVTNDTFGGEGSGAKTYLVFNWLPDVTYKFLTKAVPTGNNSTTYTAWFNDPNNSTNGGWRLIAEMTRPKISTYLTGIYSFIECFNPDTGNKTRMGYYGNQWYYDSTNTWKESTSTSIGLDDAGRTKIRRDVEGGVYNSNMYFLRNGGFFNTTSATNTVYTRTANQIPPSIDFATLP